MPTTPLVSVLVAVHNGERHLRSAIDSVLAQTARDFELVVVDDGSTDSTPDVLAAVADPRLRVVRRSAQSGLAGALNSGLDVVQGRFVARMDADDVAFPYWLERVLRRIESEPRVALVGAGIVDLEPSGRIGEAHLPESGSAVTRWYSLFSASPFFHNTVIFDRELFEAHGLRYDESYGESEDYELWTRVLEHAEADALDEALVLYRHHAGQASRRRRDLQRELGRAVATRQIAAVAPSLTRTEMELAWRFGYGGDLADAELDVAATAYLELYHRFSDSGRYSHDELAGVRRAVARRLAARGKRRTKLLRAALELDPAIAVNVASRRRRRAAARREARRLATAMLEPERPDRAIRVAAVFPEPTPYRAPLLDLLAAREEVDLSVIYAASTVASRTWEVEAAHDAQFLRGLRVPGARQLLHHDYPLTPGVVRALERAHPDVVVVSGWSTFAAQGAIAWSRARRIPYVLVVESHDEGPRPGWRRTVKGTVVPPIVRGASGALVTGTLARRSMVERGARPEDVHVFANTIDVESFGARADELRPARYDLRAELDVADDDVVVVSVARLVPEKAHDVLVRAVASANDTRIVLVLVGEGPERARLRRLADDLGVRLVLTGDRPWERIVEAYVAADVFALLSAREPWGVVVNEAAACGLPLVLSDRVGAAHDLLQNGENGFLVPAGDIDAAAAALRRLAEDAGERRRMGNRSRELVQKWGYGPSVDGFLAAVRKAANHGER